MPMGTFTEQEKRYWKRIRNEQRIRKQKEEQKDRNRKLLLSLQKVPQLFKIDGYIVAALSIQDAAEQVKRLRGADILTFPKKPLD